MQSETDAVVRVRLALIDTDAMHASSTRVPADVPYVGEVEGVSPGSPLCPGDHVVGIGPLADRLAVRAGDLVRCPDGLRAEEAVLLPVVASVLWSVRESRIAPGDRVLVTGRGLAAKIAGLAASRHPGVAPVRHPGSSAPQADSGAHPISGKFDVLIDTTADPAWWGWSLERVVDGGRVSLLLPPGICRHPFDFYPNVHRHSLILSAERVPSVAVWERTAAHVSRLTGWLAQISGGLIQLEAIQASALQDWGAALSRLPDGAHGIVATWPD